MNILEVRELSKSFGGVRAVERVSFSVAAGERLAMIGPNGAGKTTCFNLINGQLQPDAGEILFEEKPLRGHAPSDRCRLGIGRTFQVAATFTSMTVRENVQVALHARGRKREEATQLLELTSIHQQADSPCSDLAYGDLKRVELAIALAARPRLLLMDEPTAGMAAAERHALMSLVSNISTAQSVTRRPRRRHRPTCSLSRCKNSSSRERWNGHVGSVTYEKPQGADLR